MADRVCRMITAAIAEPSTIAGMIIRRRFSSGSSSNGTNPDAGSQPRAIANSRMPICPNQKFGMDSPSRATEFAAHSSGPRLRTAAITPAESPMRMATIMASSASSSVTGSACWMISVTGSPVRTDLPRSPESALPMYLAYCTGIGWSRPYEARTSAMACGSPSSPASTLAGSPGSARMPKNTTTVARNSVMTDSISRRARYRPIIRCCPRLFDEPGGAEPDDAVAELLDLTDLVADPGQVLLPVQVLALGLVLAGPRVVEPLVNVRVGVAGDVLRSLCLHERGDVAVRIDP